MATNDDTRKIRRNASAITSPTDDWDKDQDRALLKRRKSMDFAQFQLATLEAKYTSNSHVTPREQTCLDLLKQGIDAQDDEALHTWFSDNYCASAHEDPSRESRTCITIAVVCVTDLEEMMDIPHDLAECNTAKQNSLGHVNAHFLKEALVLMEKIKEKYWDSTQQRVATFTGYSLGAGVATVLTWLWPHATDLLVFGSPHVGDRAFGQELSSSARSTARYVYADDPVCQHVPYPPKPGLFDAILMCGRARSAQALTGAYRHVGPEVKVWVDELGTHKEVVRKKRGVEDVGVVEVMSWQEMIDDLDGRLEVHDIENYIKVFKDAVIEHK